MLGFIPTVVIADYPASDFSGILRGSYYPSKWPFAEKAMSDVKPPFIRRVALRDYKSIRMCDVALGSLTLLVGLERIGKEQLPGRLAAYFGCAANEPSRRR